MIPAGGKGLVKTELSIAIPRDTYARIGASFFVSILLSHTFVGVVVDFFYWMDFFFFFFF